jgi:hypothetical protein
MKKSLALFIVNFCILSNLAFGQKDSLKNNFFEKHPFINQTEFGLLIGRVINSNNYYYPYYSSYIPVDPTESFNISNVTSFSIESFNGIYIKPKTAVGITAGVDWYNTSILLPISLGIRQTIAQKSTQGSKFVTGLDIGYATNWINKDNSNTLTKGGFSLNPNVGLKFPMRSGSYWLINLGYRYQFSTVTVTSPTDSIYENFEKRNYNRLDFKLGFEF